MYNNQAIYAFIFRLIISLSIFLVPGISPLLKGIFLIYLSDFLDDVFFKWKYPMEKHEINQSFDYQLTDKIADFVTNLLGILILSTIIDEPIINIMLFWRMIGISVFTQIRSSYVWLIFPDLTKELYIVRLLFGEITPVLLIVTLILKICYEYYHHFITNHRDFDHQIENNKTT
jgi:hypothetical protein